MDDELPSKMTHNELVDLHMSLRVLKLRAQEAAFYGKLMAKEIEAILHKIDSKIITE